MPIHHQLDLHLRPAPYGNAGRTATRVVDEFEDVCEQTGVTLSRPLLAVGVLVDQENLREPNGNWNSDKTPNILGRECLGAQGV
jgi:hypothetical protein